MSALEFLICMGCECGMVKMLCRMLVKCYTSPICSYRSLSTLLWVLMQFP